MRNSILFNRGTGGTTGTCIATGQFTYSAIEPFFGGTGNVDLGDPTQAPSLFVDLNASNLRLSAAGKAQLGAVAQWRTGDPPTDIDGAPRPTTDGASDAPGADVGP